MLLACLPPCSSAMSRLFSIFTGTKCFAVGSRNLTHTCFSRISYRPLPRVQYHRHGLQSARPMPRRKRPRDREYPALRGSGETADAAYESAVATLRAGCIHPPGRRRPVGRDSVPAAAQAQGKHHHWWCPPGFEVTEAASTFTGCGNAPKSSVLLSASCTGTG